MGARSDWEAVRTLVGVVLIDQRRARGETGPGGAERRGLFGGQMIAQYLAACAHTVPIGSVPDSMLLSPDSVTSVSATHSLWFHRPTRTGDWHLLEVNAESIFDNQAFVEAALFDAGGRLAMSIAQGVCVRRVAPHTG